MGEDYLDETELEILRKAGIISRTEGKGKKPQHIVFVDNEEEGECHLKILFTRKRFNSVVCGSAPVRLTYKIIPGCRRRYFHGAIRVYSKSRLETT
jgi:hypothetical protein